MGAKEGRVFSKSLHDYCTISVGDGVPHLKAGAAGQARSKFVRQTFICVRTGVFRIQMGFLRIHMPLE